ncbi:MAG: conserved membrane protein of unknown function [Promethearchaeota archaeon]|nr:MAG: conserved membrane protein of unknown function [Candidatus Lokiarchaeota archaeon]
MEPYLIYLQVLSVFGLALLFHKKIGKYPQPLESIRSQKREVLEALLLWGIMFIFLTYFMLRVYYFEFLFYPILRLMEGILITPYLIASFILPFIFLRGWKRGEERKGFMFKKPKNNKDMLLFIGIFLLYAFITFLVAGGQEQSIFTLLWGIVTPSLAEELVSRAGIQTKLERAYGIKVSWFFGGILFGLLHIPNDFFGFFWREYGENFIISLGLLLVQIGSGWMFAIVFTKTRSIFPCILAHYLVDFFPAILAIIL